MAHLCAQEIGGGVGVTTWQQRPVRAPPKHIETKRGGNMSLDNKGKKTGEGNHDTLTQLLSRRFVLGMKQHVRRDTTIRVRVRVRGKGKSTKKGKEGDYHCLRYLLLRKAETHGRLGERRVVPRNGLGES